MNSPILRGGMSRIRLIIRSAAYAAIFLAVWEICARIQDAAVDGAPLLGSYSYLVMLKHDEFGITGVPHAHYSKWELNSLGFRGPEVKWDRERIICIGSSDTFGLFESPGMEYPRQLERELNARAGSEQYSVINVAYAGQSLGSFVRRAESVISEIRPSVAVVYPAPTAYIDPPSPDVDAWVPKESRFELRIHDRIFRLLDAFLPLWVQNIRYEFKIWRKTRHTEVMVRLPEAHVTRFREDLSKLVDELLRNGVEPVLVTHATRFGSVVSENDRPLLLAWRTAYPTLDDNGFLDVEERLNEVIRQEAVTKGLPLVEAARTLHGSDNFADWEHFTDRGAHALACEIAKPILAKTAAPTRCF